MFLRATKRFKDGKIHFYWSLVESVRAGRRVFQRQVPGLTPRQIIEKFRTVKMVDVVMPTTDGRVVTLPHGENGSVVKTYEQNPSMLGFFIRTWKVGLKDFHGRKMCRRPPLKFKDAPSMRPLLDVGLWYNKRISDGRGEESWRN